MAFAFKSLRIRHRGALVAATLSLQTLVLGAGGYLMFQGTKTGLQSRVGEGLSAENERLAENFLQLVRRHAKEPFTYGSPTWKSVQNEVEQFSLPANAQLIVLDESNRVLCHSDLQSTPALRRLDLSWQQVREMKGDEISTIAATLPVGKAVSLKDALSEGAGSSAMALIYDPDVHVKVLVHRPAGTALIASSRLTDEALLWAAASGVILVGITLVGSSILVRKYDSALQRLNGHLEQEVDRRTRQGLVIRNGLIFGLAKLAEERDNDTGRHLERICQYSAVLASELRSEFGEITNAWIERLKLAASMHDIGKVGIPDNILCKAGPLTPQERVIMQTHAQIGAETLAAIRQRVGDDELLNMGIQVALAHHERFDGAGYPHGISGEAIPLAARIVALADVYDALTSKRVYKQAMTHDQARAAIRDQRDKQFDPRVVDAFERIQRQFDGIRKELACDTDVVEKPRTFRLSEQHAEVAKKKKAA
ncbi:MAG: HD domain-containing protein [Phycisphaerales bacterium]